MVENQIRSLFAEAGIQVNGPNPWDIQIHDNRLYKRIRTQKSVGLGEAYMDGWWDCDRVDEFIHKLLVSDVSGKVKGNLFYLLTFLPGKL